MNGDGGDDVDVGDDGGVVVVVVVVVMMMVVAVVAVVPTFARLPAFLELVCACEW